MCINPSFAVDNVKKSSITSNQNTMSVVSSTENVVKNNPACSFIKDVADSSERSLLPVNNIIYAFIGYSPSGDTGFYAFGPGDITRYRYWEGGIFTSGSWTNDGKWLCCMYGNGTLYEMDPKTFDAWTIGNGGYSLQGLSYDPVTEELYGITTQALYEVDMYTGEEEFIGFFGTTQMMGGIAFDANGVLYGWDAEFAGSSHIYTIDTTTGAATQVCSLGITLAYVDDGSFDLENGVLYFSGFEINPSWGGYWFAYNENTGAFTVVGDIPGTTDYTVLAISYEFNITPPVTTASFDPPEPNGDNGWYVSNVTVKLNATDNTGVIATYYRINGGEWKTYDSPFVISEDGMHTIEYYSYDYVGNIEDVKSSTIYIDKIPPETSLEYKAWKENCKWYVKFIFNITDPTSGAGGKVEWSLNDVTQKIDESPGPTYEWTIEWSPDYGHSSVIFKATTWDKAGNQANESIKGSDIKSHPRSQSVNTFQSSNMLFWEILGRVLMFGWFQFDWFPAKEPYDI